MNTWNYRVLGSKTTIESEKLTFRFSSFLFILAEILLSAAEFIKMVIQFTVTQLREPATSMIMKPASLIVFTVLTVGPTPFCGSL